MSSDKMLKKLLEPEPPRLSDAAAARLDARVAEAMTASTGSRFRLGLALPMVAVPALLIALFVIWSLPGDNQINGSDYYLLNEEEFLTALLSMDPDDSTLEAIFDDELTRTDTMEWTETDWNAYRSELEDFSLTDMGGI